MSFSSVVWVGLGGMLGSIARYITAKSIDERLNSYFPYGTLVVNLIGSLIIGFLIAWIAQKSGDRTSLKLFLGTGFCGGFTTFSAFALENVTLLEQKLIQPALLYTFATLIAGFAFVIFGMFLAKVLSA